MRPMALAVGRPTSAASYDPPITAAVPSSRPAHVMLRKHRTRGHCSEGSRSTSSNDPPSSQKTVVRRPSRETTAAGGEQEEALEIKSLRRTIAAYANYRDAAERDVKRYERSFEMLPPAHKELLSHLGLKYQRLRRCISMNAAFIKNMLEAFEPPFDVNADDGAHDTDCCVSPADDNVTPQHRAPSPLRLNVPPMDADKVRYIIRNIVRDWAEEGQKERDECYKPILEDLSRLFPNRSKQSPPSCLIPGAGLGRLAFEISSLGFVSQGNEFSYYMSICSSFILNHTQEVNQWTIYPWIHTNCNSLSDNDQFRPVPFPDIHPSSAGVTEGFSMCTGDFIEVYNKKSQECLDKLGPPFVPLC